jgi:YidC/Oxa1 family membrane protein insertase
VVVAVLASRQLGSTATSGATSATTMRLLPFGTVVFAAFVPVATAIYLLTSTAWTVAERGAVSRFLG